MTQGIDQELAAAVEVLSNKVERDAQVFEVPDTFRPRRLANARELPYLRIWPANGDLIKSDRLEVPLPTDGEGAERRSGATTRFRHRSGTDGTLYREAFAIDMHGSTILVGRDVSKDYQDLRRLGLLLIALWLGVQLLGWMGSYWISKQIVQPIRAMSEVSLNIASQTWSDRIDTSSIPLELMPLAETLNTTFDRLQASFDRQKRFTSDASHELRTPLSVIRLQQQLALSRDRSPEEYRRTLEICERASTQMQSLVESLLTLARLDASTGGIKDSPFSAVDLAIIVEDCALLLEPLAREKEIEVVRKTSPAIVSGNPSQLSQLVSNLICNAIAYSPTASVVVVSTECDATRAILSVTDQGPGISEDEAEKIFEPFYRSEQSRNKQSGGTGLGLSICRKIVEAHQGEIRVISQSGTGARFEVSLPLLKAQGAGGPGLTGQRNDATAS